MTVAQTPMADMLSLRAENRQLRADNASLRRRIELLMDRQAGTFATDHDWEEVQDSREYQCIRCGSRSTKPHIVTLTCAEVLLSASEGHRRLPSRKGA